MRYAIYFTPRRDEPLARMAADWLGRDAYGGEVREHTAIAGFSAAEIAFHTASARRYGFHATLKAPFRLAEGESEVAMLAGLEDFCQMRDPVVIPRMRLARMSGFYALVPDGPNPALDMLAADVVTGFERFRAPLTEAEIARRNPDALNPLQLRNLHGWGYPHVFDQFRFHMTLTGRIGDEEAPRVERAVAQWFGSLIDEPLVVDTLALFVEPEPGAPFIVHTARALGLARQRRSA